MFLLCATQWHVGFAGLIGLRYEAVETIMRILNIPRHRRLETLHKIRIMEQTVLAEQPLATNR